MATKDGKAGLLSKWKIDEKPVKIDKWDGAAVKNSLDDAAKKHQTMGTAASSVTGECVRTTVFRQERVDGITYRIPSLLRLPESGTLLAFAEKRATSSDTDALLLVMRRGQVSNESVQWSPMEELQDATLPGHRTMNPCPVYERDSGTLILFFICVPERMSEGHQLQKRKNAAKLCYVKSTDQGQTWSAVVDLTDSVIGEKVKDWATFAVGPGHGIQTTSEKLIVPAYAYLISSSVQPHAFYFYSTDHGKTWHVGDPVDMWSCECMMAEVVDRGNKGHVYCNARNKSDHRVEALGHSQGTGFSKPALAPKLVEQHRGCQGSVIGFPAPKSYLEEHSKESADPTDSLTWLLFSHPADRKRRRNLGMYLNKRPLQGSDWEGPRIINRGPSGYSDIAYCEDEDVFVCLMECGEKSEVEQIASLCFSLNDVLLATEKKAETP